MTAVICAAATLCVAMTAAHVASIVVAMVRCRATGGRLPPPPGAPPVSLLRPVCGVDNYAEETLRSAFLLDYPDYEIVLCVAHAKDPVVPLIERLIADHPGVPARLLIGNERISDNPKLNNLVKGWPAASRGWVVIADSNVLMPPDYIQRLLAAWEPDTGLVCSPPVGAKPDGIWAELECAFLNTYQARWQYFADSLGLGFAQGKNMLWRRADLDRVGGIKALAAELAEDAAGTKVVRNAGLRVRLVDRPFIQPLGARGALEVWRRQVRWARLRRATFRLFFLPELLSGAAPALVAGGLAAAGLGSSVLAVLAALGVTWYGGEALLARAAGWHLSARSPLVWMLRDLLLPVLWLEGWFGSSFVWRGNHMRVEATARSS
ncbi:MAG TPA: ceramide glucosyltransferase [Xanthobacteraceae bacterium]|nr:ceramide glucosyltransferase [Xanthobacteraceae bacterium]